MQVDRLSNATIEYQKYFIFNISAFQLLVLFYWDRTAMNIELIVVLIVEREYLNILN